MSKELKAKLYNIFMRDEEIMNLIKDIPEKYLLEEEKDEKIQEEGDEEAEEEAEEEADEEAEEEAEEEGEEEEGSEEPI